MGHIRGTCPGPLFAQIRTGATVVAIILLSAIAVTWVNGFLDKKFSTKSTIYSYDISVKKIALSSNMVFY